MSVVALLLKMKANTKVSDKEGNTPLHIAMKNNNKEIISILLSKSKELPFKSKQPRSHRSIDVMKKYSLSRKRSTNNDQISSTRYNSQYIEEVNKKFSKYKKNSDTLPKNQPNNYTISKELRENKYTRIDEKSPLTNMTYEPKSQRNSSPLSSFSQSYKTKRVLKNHLYKAKTNLNREIDTSTPTIPGYKTEAISSATSKGSKLPLHMNKWPSSSIRFLEETSKASSKNSPQVTKRNQHIYDKDNFKTQSETDSQTRKYRNEFMNYLKPTNEETPERYLHTLQDDSKKQSLYQGGFVDETEEGKQADQEFTEFVESEEAMADLPERGNKAESDNDSKIENDEIEIKEEVFYESDRDEMDQSESYPPGEDNEISCEEIKQDFNTSSKLPNPHPIQPENNEDDEEQVYYRGRGLQNSTKIPKIPKELHNIQGKEITPEMFEIHSMLGKGAFGKVYLVTKKDTGVQYAMKVLSKETIIKSKITRYALTEKNIMSRIPHPFIVGLHFAFQTNDFLYLILDLCSQGNMGDHLDAVNNIDEQTSKYYA